MRPVQLSSHQAAFCTKGNFAVTFHGKSSRLRQIQTHLEAAATRVDRPQIDELREGFSARAPLDIAGNVLLPAPCCRSRTRQPHRLAASDPPLAKLGNRQPALLLTRHNLAPSILAAALPNYLIHHCSSGVNMELIVRVLARD